MKQIYFKEYIDNGFTEYRPNKEMKNITLRGYINGTICEFPCLVDARWFCQVVKTDKVLSDLFTKRAENFIASLSMGGASGVRVETDKDLLPSQEQLDASSGGISKFFSKEFFYHMDKLKEDD